MDQVQGNFLIRRAQAETAMEMISPQSGINTVMQANMGDGKSLLIIPEALAVQTFESLVARLGSDDLHTLMSQCVAECGILCPARARRVTQINEHGAADTQR